jgi:carboxypeptidase C (cathepsin A)
LIGESGRTDMRITIIRLFLTLFITCSSAVLASDKPSGEAGDKTINTASEIPKPEQSVTQHKIVIGGQTISYTATAGTLIVRNEKDLPYASIGYIAYTKSDSSDPGRRPVTFAYNGGPGASSVWLHMGVLGPRRIVTKDPGFTPPPPYRTVDNEFSILDKTDLVMIDPVGTGFGRAIGESKDKDFFSVDSDIESISRFIKQYISDNGRWNSPKFLLGESYGTTRSAGIVDYLQCNESMAFNGVILVSMATDIELLFYDAPGNEWNYPFSLPTYTGVAWLHKMLPNPPADIAPLLREVRAFALGEYSHALALGNDLPEAERKAIIAKLHRYTGLSMDYLDKADLRVTVTQFAKEILHESRETLGQLDARFRGVTFDPLVKDAEYDPMDAATGGAFAASFFDYLHRDLNFGQGKTYVLQSDAWKTWDYRHKITNKEIPQYTVNTGLDLAHAMGFNPHLRVLVLQGIYDLASFFLATEYMVSHLNLTKDLRSHIEVKYYEAGHMMYIHEPSLKKFKEDVGTFIGQ